MSVYLRPLRLDDAKTSWQWRNDPEVWKYTGAQPMGPIDEATETAWIAKVLSKTTEQRYAICISETGEYIGNAHFTDVGLNSAQLHLFIGEKKYWGKGFGFTATKALLEKADNARWMVVFLLVDPANVAAIKIYEKLGFISLGLITDRQLLMERRTGQIAPLVSVFMMSYNHAPFIETAIKSVFDQKVAFDIEIVLSDDFSQDDTRLKIFNCYRAQPALFTLLLPNHRMGAVENQWKVFDACKGKYIAMLEGDDYWTDPNKLQMQTDYLEAHPETAITFHNCEIKNDLTGEIEGYSNLETQAEITTLADLSLFAYPYTPSVVFRSAPLQTFPTAYRRFMNNRTLDLFNAHFGNLKYFRKPMAVYRKHEGGSWSMVPRTNTLLNQLPIYQFYADHFDKKYHHHFMINLKNMTAELMELQLQNKCYTPFFETLKWYLKYHRKTSGQHRRLLQFVRGKIRSIFF